MSHPQRKHPRLPEYDYAQQGAYFLTICTKHRACILSRIILPESEADDASVSLTEIGEIALRHLQRIPGLDSYVIMPNHIHLIVFREAGDRSISSDIRSFKTLVTKKVGQSIWQTSFHDHILRDPNDYLFHREYMDKNPAKWLRDPYYSA